MPAGMPVACRIRSGRGSGGVQTSGQFITTGGRGIRSCVASRSAYGSLTVRTRSAAWAQRRSSAARMGRIGQPVRENSRDDMYTSRLS